MKALLAIEISVFSALFLGSSTVTAGDPDLFRGVESIYTHYLMRIARDWPPKNLDFPLSDPKIPVQLRCYETPGNEFYIGLEQRMEVHAPMETVEAILDDFDHYRDLFPGFNEIRVIQREGNQAITFWEQHVPFFLAPNVKYEVIYRLDKANPNRRMYRYQLRKAGQLKSNDGLIVLERNGRGTHYFEFDFFDAEWGLAKVFAPGRIWRESVEGIYLSDLAIKIKSENPIWSYSRVSEESRKVLDRFPVGSALENKVPAPVLAPSDKM